MRIGNETQFRTLEYQILMDLAQYTRVVVSTGGNHLKPHIIQCLRAFVRFYNRLGGGIVLKPENWGLLHHGVVVYLDMEAQDIYDRYTPLANILISIDMSIFSLFIKSHIEVSIYLSNCFHHAYLLT